MTPREEILSRFGKSVGGGTLGSAGAGPLFMPDLSLWYRWHKRWGTLPPEWQNLTQDEVAWELGTPAWIAIQPWRARLTGIETLTEERAEEKIVRHMTRSGTLTARWSLGPDSDWWQSEYPVKGAVDLPAAREIIAARSYEPQPEELAAVRARVGERGVVAIELPMRPYSDLLHTMLGWAEGLMLFAGEGGPILQEIMGILEDKLQGIVQKLAAMPGELFLAPDNLDGQYISPRAFRGYLAESYRCTAEVAHAHDMRLAVHAGGPVRRLLPLLAEVGVDGVEGVAGSLQGDASLAEARALAGPDFTLWGGIPQDLLLPIHSQEAFKAAVLQAARDASGDPRMILGVADRVSADSDTDRLRAIARLIGGAL